MAGIVSGVGAGVTNLANATGTAISGTTAIAEKSVQVATKTTGKVVDAAGVLGVATVDAAQKLGSAGIETGSQLGEAGLKATGSIGTAVLGTTATVTKSSLDTASKVADSALDATAKVTDVTLDAGTTTVAATGDVLKAGVGAATTLATTGLNGVRRTAELMAGKGNLAADRIAARTAAQSQVLTSMGQRRIMTEEAAKEFDKSAHALRSGLKQLTAIQKTVLAANISMYRGTQCGWFKRAVGRCVPEVTADVTKANALADRLLQAFDTQTRATRMKLTTGTEDPAGVVESFLKGIDDETQQFQTAFGELIKSYQNRTDAALTKTGGRRKTRRVVLQRRPLGRVRRALRRVTRRGKRGT
jgi:hypothetical protein